MARRTPSYTDADYVAMWEEMSRPPRDWVVLERLVEEAEAKSEATERVQLLSEALKRLDDYLEATAEPDRIAASKISAMRQRIHRARDSSLAELRRRKDSERPARAEGTSLVEIVKRLRANLWPIPFTPGELEKLAGVAPFVSGPHIAGFDRRYIESFGRYNPKFVQWARNPIASLDAESFQAIDSVYHELLAHHGQYLLGARYYLLANPTRERELRGRYELAVKEKRPFNPVDEIPYVEGSYDGTYLAYWLRREIDGTAGAVQELAEAVIGRFQPGGLLKLQKEFGRDGGVVLTLPGSYHSDELEIADGEKVFAFVRDGKRAELRADVAKVERTHDAVMDEKGEASGKSISLVSTRDEEAMILRGRFVAGPVTTVMLPPLRECIAGCQLLVGGNRYQVTVEHVDENMPESLEVQPVPGFLVQIRNGDTTMHLRSVREIVWMGDLDRDGKLDIIYDDRFHYNVGTSMHLLLSSASANAMPREVSHCLSVGC